MMFTTLYLFVCLFVFVCNKIQYNDHLPLNFDINKIEKV